MNIEEEIKQVWHDDSVKFWADQYGKLNIYSEAMKLELAKPEPDQWEARRYLAATRHILTFGDIIPEELGWKQFAEVMPNLAKGMKENFDKLESKVRSQAQAEWAERQAKKAKLPWYKRWFA